MSETPAPAETPAVSAIEAMYGKPEAAAPPETAAPETPEVPETTETPEVKETAETAETPEEAAPETPAAEQTEEVSPTTIAELAEHLEVDPEWLKTLKVSEKVNGQAVEFSIADALATHRKVAAADTYLADAKEKSKAMLAETEQHKQSWAATVTTVGKLLQSIETEIARDTKNLLTDKLKEEDPALYAVRQNDIRERRERLDAMKREAQQSIHEAAQKTAQEQQTLLTQRLPKERELFLDRVPEWVDAEKAKAEMSALANYLEKEGFSVPEIRTIAHNGKVMAAFVKAMRSDAAKTKSEAIRKKVVKIPKVLKPGPKPAAAAKPNGAAKSDPVSILYG